MAPDNRGGGGNGKRKRPDRSESGDGHRPSPHRAELGRRDQSDDRNNNRRPSRGGRGGGPGGGGGGGSRPRNDRRESGARMNVDPNNMPVVPRPGPMSPPLQRPAPASQPPAQQPTTTPVPMSNPSTPEPRPQREIFPYNFTHLTDERVSSWATGGKDAVIGIGKQAIQDEDEFDVAIIFQEVLRSVLDNRIEPAEAGSCLKAIFESEDTTTALDAPRTFLDCLSILMESEPYDPILQDVISESGISELLMRQMLDAPLLQSLGLTRPTFMRAGIRQVTNLLYRQSNHNLLREETEGYSKLVTELFTTSATSVIEPQPSDLADEAFERVKGLIGTFDLDVGRVLDVTLDVFAAVCIKQFRFFIKLLRISSWWPRDHGSWTSSVPGLDESGLPKWALPDSSAWNTSEEDEQLVAPLREARDQLFWDRARQIGLDAFFELGGRRAADQEARKILSSSKQADSTDEDATNQWIEATGTMPPAGNRVAAQLLGFKLRFYSSEARGKEDVLPANLIYLAALLIKIGFISLRDLYPHLWPNDDDMETVKAARMKELAEKEKANRPGGANNALMMAGALADDTIPTMGRQRETTTATKADATSTPNADSTSKEELDVPTDQKIQLLTNLLTIGALPEALFILGKFPWIPEAYPELYGLIHRILNYSIKKVFENSQIPPVEEQALPAKKCTEIDASLPQKFRQVDPPTRKALRWPFPDKSDVNEGFNYRFYWDEWNDNIPICQNVDDVFTLCGTLLNISGVNIGRDVSLLSKLASIGTRSLANDHSEANLARWQDLLKRLLVPALSLTKANTSVVNEIYDMLRYYPASIRYNIYAEWFEGQVSRLPAMQVAFQRARLETLSTMKRISMTNLTTMARALAKTAYASPGIVFKVALDQIEAYSNLTEVVVECAKYFTDLGYDVLLWALMSSLGGQNRTRTRADDALLTSRWLIALAKFSGKVFKRYSIMNPAPILQYVNDQLFRGNSTDLIILEQLIAQMAGVVSDLDFTDAQMLAMTGGELLRKQTLINLQDRRFESTKTAKRLLRSLTETNLGGQLLVAIAQHRQSAIHAVPEDEAHIKYLATIIDDTQRILFQYLDLLRSNLSVAEFDALVPSTGQLLSEFNLEPSLAFLLGRASLATRLSATAIIQSKTADSAAQVINAIEKESVEVGDSQTDVAMSDVNAVTEGQKTPEDKPSPPDASESWGEILTPLVDAVQKVLPADTWKLISPEFYAVFWQLSLSDVHFTMDSYTIENTRLTREISDIMKDRADQSRMAVSRKEEARKLLEDTRDSLLRESKQQMIKYDQSRKRLNEEKTLWFVNGIGNYNNMNDALWEECFIPRLLLSPGDADYCFRMIKFLHSTGTPHFRTLGIYARMFRPHRLRTLIFTCTIREAENLGRFIKLVFADLARWHSSKFVFEKEALGQHKDLIGFAKKLNESGKPEIVVEYDEFRRVLFAWHKNLNIALKSCLMNKEWMHIRNGITVLKGVVEAFPTIDFMGKAFQETLTKIGKDEKDVRDDLSLTANALLPELKKRQSKWVMPQAFATNLGDLGIPPPASTADTSKAGTAQPEAGTTKGGLKPTAPEFKPQSRSVSGELAMRNPSKADVEDGEVDDKNHQVESKGRLSETETTTGGLKPVLLDSKDNLSRGSTPKPLELSDLPSRSPRPNASRSSSSAPRERLNNVTLPNRPDGPVPQHSELDRHRSRLSGRDDLIPRHERLSDTSRDRTRDGSRRGTPDLLASSSGRLSDRNDRDGNDMRPDRTRDHKDRRIESSRADMNVRRDEDMRDADATSERVPLVNPERLSLVDQDRENVDPSRAALISGNPDLGKPSMNSRNVHGGRTSSRAHSPRGERYQDRERADDRHRSTANHIPVGERQDSRRRNNDLTPSGPRNDRNNDRGPSDRARDASAFTPSSLPPPSNDPDHGRLSRGSQQDSTYGRLNAGPDPPSGPRSQDTRGGPTISRTSNDNHRPKDTRGPRQEPNSTPVLDRGPPTGPSSDRGSRGNASGRYESSAPLPTPPVAAPQSPIVGVHPSRAGKIVDVPPPPPPPAPQQTLSGPPVHPSRQSVLQLDRAPVRQTQPVNTSNFNPGSNAPSPQNGPPSGPRGGSRHSNSNSVSIPNTPTPTGPSGGDNGRGVNDVRRRFAGLQNIISSGPGTQQQGGLSPVNDRVMSIKGRGGRSSFGSHESSIGSVPPPPPGPPPHSMSNSGRDQLFGDDRDLINSDRLGNLRDAPQEDSRDRGRGSGRGRDLNLRHDDQSSRNGHRGSRDRSPKRDRTDQGDKSGRFNEERQERGNHRDSRGGRSGRDGDRDRERRHGSERGREAANEVGDRDNRGAGRPAEQGREDQWNGDRAGPRGGSHRSGGRESRGGDERRDNRHRGEDGGNRKRSSEEGPNIPGSDSKRPRH